MLEKTFNFSHKISLKREIVFKVMILCVVIPVLTKTNRDMSPQILKYKECLLHMTSRWNALH